MNVELTPETIAAYIQDQVAQAQAQVQAQAQAGLTSMLTEKDGDDIDKNMLSRLPEFHGRFNEDVLQWIYLLNKSFAAAQLPENRRMDRAVALLRSHALTWWQVQEELSTQLPTTWEEFQRAIKDKFTDPNQDTINRKRLDRCKQLTSVRRYATEFEQLAIRIRDTSKDDLLHRFIEGLKPQTRNYVRQQHAVTLEDAVLKAEIYDSTAFSSNTNRNTTGGQHHTYSSQDGVQPMVLGALTSQTKFKKLTPDERERLEKAGICKFCRNVNCIGGKDIRNCPILQKRHPNGNRQ